MLGFTLGSVDARFSPPPLLDDVEQPDSTLSARLAGGRNMSLFGTNTTTVQQDGSFVRQASMQVPRTLVTAAREREVDVVGGLAMDVQPM